MMQPELWQSLGLTFQLASITTLLLLVCGLPLAHFLNSLPNRFGAVLETIVGLPIVLPPTVLGFYLLVIFAPQNFFGSVWQRLFGQQLAFSFPGLVLGSMLYSLPFAIQPFQSALRGIPRFLIEAAVLEGNPVQVFWHVRLPLALRGIVVGATLAFAHTVGEFGVVMMIGGSIPGITKVASVALYNEVQKPNYAVANQYAVILLALSFCLLLAVVLMQRHSRWFDL
jgi:molybdate transport system permease protein